MPLQQKNYRELQAIEKEKIQKELSTFFLSAQNQCIDFTFITADGRWHLNNSA